MFYSYKYLTGSTMKHVTINPEYRAVFGYGSGFSLMRSKFNQHQ